MTSYREWLATLKPGDSWEYVTEWGIAGTRVFRATVIRVTKTQIVCEIGGFEKLFRLDSGLTIGDSDLCRLPMPATDEQIQSANTARKKKIRLNGIIGVLRAEGQTLPLETIEQIAELIEKARTAKERG